MSYSRKQQLTGCQYFNGLQHEKCSAGIRYAEVKRPDNEHGWLYPCRAFQSGIKPMINTCDQRFVPSDDIIDRNNAERASQTAQYIEKLNAFSSGESHACPHCGQEVTSARLYSKTEPDMFSLYVLPCGDRLGLWSAAPAWITDVEIIDPEQEYIMNEQRRAIKDWNEKIQQFNTDHKDQS